MKKEIKNTLKQLRKWYFRGGLFLLAGSIFLSPLFVVQQVVAQDADSTSENILNQSLEAQEVIAEAMNTMWNDILNSGVWEAMIWVSTFFALGLVAIWVVKLVKDSLSNEISSDYFSAFFWLFLVILLLLNNGAALREVVLGLRAIINHTNEQVLAVQVDNVSLEDHFNEVVTSSTLDGWYQQEYAECLAITDEKNKQDCIDELNKKAEETSDDIASERSWWPGGFDPVQATKDAVGDALQYVVRIWLLAMGVAFQWLVEITLLLTGLIAPLAVSGSLLPLKQRPIFTWLTGFYSVGSCKLFYNIVVGLVAAILSKTTTSGNPTGGSILFALVVGILAPVLAVTLAAGAGMTTFLSLSSLTSLAAGAVAGVPLGLAGKAATAAGGAVFGQLGRAGNAAKGAMGKAFSHIRPGGGGGSGGRPRYSSSGRTSNSPQLPPP